jgi:cell division protein FtsB
MIKFTEEVADVIAMLEQENRLIRARNERLEKEYDELEKQYYVLKEQCDLFKNQIRTESGGTGCCKECD